MDELTNTAEAPYRALAGELVADCLALVTAIELALPAAAGVPGHYRVTLNVGSQAVTVGKVLDDGSLALIERIDVDPRSATFGASVMPIVAPRGPAH